VLKIVLNGVVLAVVMHVGGASPSLTYGVVAVYSGLRVFAAVCLSLYSLVGVLRYADVYGPGDSADKVKDALRAKQAEHEANGEWRDAADCVRALYLFSHRDEL
jgi:nucleoside-diphosphate-sugar epimerase